MTGRPGLYKFSPKLDHLDWGAGPGAPTSRGRTGSPAPTGSGNGDGKRVWQLEPIRHNNNAAAPVAPEKGVSCGPEF